MLSPRKDDVDSFLYPYNYSPHIFDWYSTFTHIIQFHLVHVGDNGATICGEANNMTRYFCYIILNNLKY